MRLKAELSKFQNLNKVFVGFVLIYLLAISSIIRANVSYVDDLKRIATGVTAFTPFSRYLSEILSQVLNAGTYLTDISPLTQIIAVIIMALASVCVLIVFSDTYKITFCQAVSVLPIGLCPYFLQCYSYKFDSPFMALSVLASVVPLVFYKTMQFVGGGT